MSSEHPRWGRLGYPPARSKSSRPQNTWKSPEHAAKLRAQLPCVPLCTCMCTCVCVFTRVSWNWTEGFWHTRRVLCHQVRTLALITLMKFLCHMIGPSQSPSSPVGTRAGFSLSLASQARYTDVVSAPHSLNQTSHPDCREGAYSFLSLVSWHTFPWYLIGLQSRTFYTSHCKLTNSYLLCNVLALVPFALHWKVFCLFFCFLKKRTIHLNWENIDIPCNFCFAILESKCLRKNVDFEYWTFVKCEVSPCLRGSNPQVLRPQRTAFSSFLRSCHCDLPSVECLPSHEEAWPGTKDRLWMTLIVA